MLAELGLNLTEIIFVIVNFLILVGVLTKFLYKPFLGAIENRKKVIQDSFDQAEATNRRADAKMAKYERRIAHAEEEGREIIRVAKVQADANAQKIIADAEKRASEIIKRAEETIKLEREKAMVELHQDIADMALLAAEQIVGGEIDKTGHEAIVDKVIDNARSTQWQN